MLKKITVLIIAIVSFSSVQAHHSNAALYIDETITV